MITNGKLNYLDFDIYSRRISFSFKNKEKIGSTFGFILTILYAIISIIVFLIHFIRTLKREEVSSSNSTIYPTEIPSLEINNDLFYFAFGLEIPNRLIRYIDESIYYPKVSFVERVKVNGEFITKSETFLKVERCDRQKFGKIYQHLIEKDEFNNSYCLKDFNLTLRGGFKYNKMSYIKINIFPCVNNTNNSNHCKSQDIIDSYLNATYFSCSTKDIGFNPFNYSFPIVPIIQDLFSSIDKSTFREYIMYFGLAQIITDKGLLTNKLEKENYVKYIRNSQSFFFLDNEEYHSDQHIFTAQIRLEDNIYFLKRKYTKMSEVFSITGGYMQIIYTIFTLIATLTKTISIELNLLNNLFNFDIKQKKIILSIEYGKKLDYYFNLEKKRKNSFIPYEARKSIVNKNDRRNSILILNKNNYSPVIKKSETENEQNVFKFNNVKNINNTNIFALVGTEQNLKFGPNKVILWDEFNQKVANQLIVSNNVKNINKMSEDKLIELFNKYPKDKENNINMNDLSINKSNNNMIFKEDNLNLYNIKMSKNKKTEGKKESNRDLDINLIKNLKKFDKGRRSTLNFNLLEYLCFTKLTKKSTEIELFHFGINFYKSQMDIIHFFNILMLTQILLTQKNDKKKNIFNQLIELSVK